jgi:CRP-like cAMP-binding protein
MSVIIGGSSARSRLRPGAPMIRARGVAWYPAGVVDTPANLAMQRFKNGEVIFRQGEDGLREAYLVHKGTVEVHREADGETHLLRTLGKGDLLGEIALFREAPHSATAIARSPVTLLVIPENRLEELVREHPALALALIRQLARMAAGDISPRE